MTNELLEQLLFSEESDSLDFKRDQYPFVGASDPEKAELLKDILAFANSWCRSDAYILIGVEDVQGGRGNVVGISSHFDDANLQQFVNSKLNRPLTFSYRAFQTTDGPVIGVIHIPRQTRPFYLKNDFVPLKASVVSVRRGSSTAIATPDEIAQMGLVVNEQKETSLQMRLFDDADNTSFASDFEIRVHSLRYNESSVPLYGQGYGAFGIALPFDIQDNREYYRELADYERHMAMVRPFRLEIENTGGVLLSNVRVKIRGIVDDLLLVEDDDFLPEKPVRQKQLMVAGFNPTLYSKLGKRRYIEIKREGETLKVFGQMLDIQPKDIVRTNDLLYIGGERSGKLKLEATVFADNLQNPVNLAINISVEVVDAELAIDAMIARSKEKE